MPGPIRHHVDRFADAATAYEGQIGLLLAALLAKFVTHFTTAIVYYFTALAIGVTSVAFLPIVFGSLIQILGTFFSPTIAGEGAREAIQALLLSHHLGGVAQAVLSGALGFIAAEAATLWGGAFLWTRKAGWRPSVRASWMASRSTMRGSTIRRTSSECRRLAAGSFANPCSRSKEKGEERMYPSSPLTWTRLARPDLDSISPLSSPSAGSSMMLL